jgi:transposase
MAVHHRVLLFVRVSSGRSPPRLAEGSRVADLAPTLMRLNGCGALYAAKVIGKAAGVSRFRSRAAFAMNNGTAPVQASSGNQQRHRLNRGGNASDRNHPTQPAWTCQGLHGQEAGCREYED